MNSASNAQELDIQGDEGRSRSRHDSQEPRWLHDFHDAVSQTSMQTFASPKRFTLDTKFYAANDVEVVFRMPALEILTLKTVQQARSMYTWTVPEASSNIQVLRLSRCYIHSDALAQILRCIKTLRHFRHLHIHPNDGPKLENRACFFWSTLDDTLRKHRKSLQELSLFDGNITNKGEDMTIGTKAGRRTLGTLREFHELRNLFVRSATIADPADSNDDLSLCLPANLQYIETYLDPGLIWSLGYAIAVASLKDNFGAGPENVLSWAMPKWTPSSQLRLSGPFQTLADAGIDIQLHIELESSYHYSSIDELHTMEADDWEASSSESESDPDAAMEEDSDLSSGKWCVGD